MSANKTPLSNASSYREIGEFWDQHDLADYWDQTSEVEMDVDIQSSSIYFAVDRTLAEKLRAVAGDNGVSPETLLNRWIEEHVGEK